MEVSGPTASVSTTGTFINVGAFDTGNGTLSISNGATVNARNVTLGNLRGSGSIVVEGAGSQLNIIDATIGDLSVAGLFGDTSVLVRDGGHIAIDGPSGLLELASNTPSTTTFTLTGTGSEVTNSGIAYIGEFGIVQASVLDQAVLTIGSDLNIGRFDDPVGQPNGQLTVDTGGQVNVAGQTIIGDAGIGVLTIAGGGKVTGPGGVVIASSATSTGTLNIGAPAGFPAAAPGILDTGNITFGTGVGAIVFNHTDSGYIFSQSITGAGDVNVLSGTTILTGTSGLTGPTNVTGGALIVDGSIANSTVTAMDGATLGGNGTVGSVLAQSGSILSPGHNGIGTLTVNGAYTQTAGSIYQVQVDPNSSASDRITVSGVANLANGAVLNVTKTSTAPYTPGTKYTVLTTTGGLTGTFNVSGETAVTPFISLFGTYDANNAYLQAEQTRSLASVGRTPNQTATAGGLDHLPPSSPLLAALLNLPTDDAARHAFDQLSGEVHATISGVLMDDSRYVRDAIYARLLPAFRARGPAGPTIAIVGSSAQGIRQEPALADYMPLGAVDRNAADVPRYRNAIAFWTSSYGAWGDFDGNGNAASVDRKLAGFISGMDAEIGNGWRAGLATGYAQASVGVDARRSNADVESYYLGGYSGGYIGDVVLRGGGVWTWSQIDTSRTVVFPGFFEHDAASYAANTGQIFAEAALPLTSPAVVVEPFGRLAYVHVGLGNFTESGALAGLSSSGTSEDVGYSSLGIKAASVLQVAGMDVTPYASVAWQRAFGDLDPTTPLVFPSADIGFEVLGVPIVRDSALIQTGLTVVVAADATLGLTYSGQIGRGFSDNAITGRFDWRF